MSDAAPEPLSFTPPPAPPPRPRQVLPFLAMVVVGAAFGLLGGRVLGHALRARHALGDLPAWAVSWLPLAWLVAVAVHEAGHLVAGVAAGMRPLLWIVGPLRLTWEGGRIRAAFNPHLATWGGIAACVPTDPARTRAHLTRFVAGGPLASVLLALACAGLAAAFGVARVAPVVLTGFMSGCIAIATLIPSRIGGLRSDGAQLLGLLRGSEDVALRALVTSIVAQSLAGRRPRDLDRTLLDRALAMRDSPADRTAMLLTAALAAADRGEDAGALFAEVGSRFHDYPPGFRQEIAHWLAWFVASVRGDLDTARRWLALGKGGLRDGAIAELAEASVAALAGDRSLALRAAERGLARPIGIDPGSAVFVREQLERVRDAARREA